jgi:hypothetical protein
MLIFISETKFTGGGNALTVILNSGDHAQNLQIILMK